MHLLLKSALFPGYDAASLKNVYAYEAVGLEKSGKKGHCPVVHACPYSDFDKGDAPVLPYHSCDLCEHSYGFGGLCIPVCGNDGIFV